MGYFSAWLRLTKARLSPKGTFAPTQLKQMQDPKYLPLDLVAWPSGKGGSYRLVTQTLPKIHNNRATSIEFYNVLS
jgi:hypothetical protein